MYGASQHMYHRSQKKGLFSVTTTRWQLALCARNSPSINSWIPSHCSNQCYWNVWNRKEAGLLFFQTVHVFFLFSSTFLGRDLRKREEKHQIFAKKKKQQRWINKLVKSSDIIWFKPRYCSHSYSWQAKHWLGLFPHPEARLLPLSSRKKITLLLQNYP